MVEIIKILVIEHRSVISKQLKQSLNRDIVFRVSDIPGAIECLKSIFFDILLVDVHQAWDDQKDYPLIRSITWMSPQIKVILMIPKGKQGAARDLEGLEIADFIFKPWEHKGLIASINYLRKSLLVCSSKRCSK